MSHLQSNLLCRWVLVTSISETSVLTLLQPSNLQRISSMYPSLRDAVQSTCPHSFQNAAPKLCSAFRTGCRDLEMSIGKEASGKHSHHICEQMYCTSKWWAMQKCTTRTAFPTTQCLCTCAIACSCVLGPHELNQGENTCTLKCSQHYSKSTSCSICSIDWVPTNTHLPWSNGLITMPRNVQQSLCVHSLIYLQSTMCDQSPCSHLSISM